ncbi:MAG: type II secretion system protein [Rhodospirillaceae bacterium]
MTVVEVMIGFVLVSILLIGMGSLWVSVSQQMDRQTLRQKAVFRLNAEMERLVKLYTDSSTVAKFLIPTAPVNVPTTEFSSTGFATDPYYPVLSVKTMYIPGPSDVRWVYNDLDPTSICTTIGSGLCDFVSQKLLPNSSFSLMPTPDTTAKVLNNIYREVYVFHKTTLGTVIRNLVWLDRSRNIVGMISWELHSNPDELSPESPLTVPVKCTAGNKCALLTLYFDYPYRVTVNPDDSDPVANPTGVTPSSTTITDPVEILGLPVETLTVQSFVGTRK